MSACLRGRSLTLLVERIGVPHHSLQRRPFQNFNISAVFVCNHSMALATGGRLRARSRCVNLRNCLRRFPPRADHIECLSYQWRLPPGREASEVCYRLSAR